MSAPDPEAKPSVLDEPTPLPDPRIRPLVAPEEPQARVAVRAMGGVGTLGIEIALSILFGLFGGQWLDGRFETKPWLTLLGFGFGIAAAVRATLRQLRRMRAEAAREELEQGNPEPLWKTRAEREAAERDTESADGAERSAESAERDADEPR